MQDREWARGMSQDDFAREFQRRNPWGDVIPGVNEWVDGKDPEYNGIPDIPPESYTQDGPDPLVKDAMMFPCRGCGREFSVAIARSGHERGCKAIVMKEAVNADT